jgi:hypothetical protein
LRQNPTIHDAGHFAASEKMSPTSASTFRKLGQNLVCRLLSIPGPSVRKYDWEIDKLESSGDEIVVIGDLVESFIADVMAHKGAAGYGAHEPAELIHEGDWLVVPGGGNFQPLLEVLVVSFVLTRKVKSQTLAGEEAVQSLPEVDVSFTVQKDPVIGAQ